MKKFNIKLDSMEDVKFVFPRNQLIYGDIIKVEFTTHDSMPTQI